MLKLDNLTYLHFSKRRGEVIRVFNGFSFSFKMGEIVAIVGPSGCGKTTLANLIAGYTRPSSGKITLNGKVVTKPGKDRILINQENDLFSWMTVYENLRLVTKDEEKIEEILALTHLLDFKDYYVTELSGGMKKRLSIARALVVESNYLIMDEPFAFLDSKSKEELYLELLNHFKTSIRNVILVTHDIEEAIFLAKKVILLPWDHSNKILMIPVPFSYPRNLDLRGTERFRKFKSVVKGKLYELNAFDVEGGGA